MHSFYIGMHFGYVGSTYTLCILLVFLFSSMPTVLLTSRFFIDKIVASLENLPYCFLMLPFFVVLGDSILMAYEGIEQNFLDEVNIPVYSPIEVHWWIGWSIFRFHSLVELGFLFPWPSTKLPSVVLLLANAFSHYWHAFWYVGSTYALCI